MLDRGWRLAYDDGTGIDFGGVDYDADPFQRGIGRLSVTGYEQTEAAVDTEDTPLPRVDGVRMGQDYRRGVTHTFTLTARGRTRSEAAALIAQAATLWRADPVRGTAGKVATLTTLQGGQQWTVFGRPRRFTPNMDRLKAAQASAVCTFDTVDDLWYGPEQSTRIDLRAISQAGFAFPVTFPLVMSPATQRYGQVSNTGLVPTPVIVEFHGPIVAPTVRSSNGWQLTLNANVPSGQVVTVDPRGWVRTILDSSRASYAGAVVRPGDLSKMLLTPGAQQLAIQGNDTTGTAYMVARWRPAYAGRG